MNPLSWRVIEGLAKMLPVREREAILGDLVELRLSAGQATFDVTGVVLRCAARGTVTALRVLVLAVICTTVLLAWARCFGLEVLATAE